MASSRETPTAGYLYGFSVAHVQRYLLATPRLREIQGGSQLLEELCRQRFEEAVEAAGLSPHSILNRAAAGARLWSADAGSVHRLYALWPRVAEDRVPGAIIQQAVVDVEEAGGLPAAQRLLGERLRASRVDRLCTLPAAGPHVELYPRTGEPAEERQKVGDEEEERVDAATHRKVEAWRNLQQQGREGSSALDRRCLGEDLRGTHRFIRGRDPLAEGLVSEENPYVGVLHADANAVGRVIESLLSRTGGGAGPAELFSRFSSALSTATQRAVEGAIRDVLLPWPVEATGEPDEPVTLRARPIVLGGDDLTFILAAPVAFRFAQSFLETFECTTQEELGALEIPGLEGLTACAGLALTKASFPFDRAHALAESLCSHAKARARSSADGETMSALAFHRVTSSLAEDVDTVYERELNGPGTRLTFEAYRVGKRGTASAPLASFTDLRKLADYLQHLPRGGLRELLAELSTSPSRADASMARILDVARRRPADRPKIERLSWALQRLTGDGSLLWHGPAADGLRRTPLLDAETLRLAERGGP